MPVLHRLSHLLNQGSVRWQLYASFAAILTLMALLGAVALTGMARVNEQAHALQTQWIVLAGHVSELRTEVRATRDLEVQHSRTENEGNYSDFEAGLAQSNQRIEAGLKGFQSSAPSEDVQRSHAEVDKTWRNYLDFQTRVVALGRAAKQDDAADMSDFGAKTAFDKLTTALTAGIKVALDGANASAALAQKAHDRSSNLVIAILALAIILGALVAFGIARRLLHQLGGEPRTAVSVARAVAEGDLSTPIALKRGDSKSLLARLQGMQTQLAAAVHDVRMAAESVAVASAQIAKGNQDLSTRTEQQAGALQQTAGTMNELGDAVRQNADSARQANELAQGAAAAATRGGQVVGEVVATMRDINDSSKKIADITSVIDSIAFQTNILALNAAVEAARAGEQGRGFAVVAAEVRSLAQRSAGAAKEIKSLIGASVERVDQGSVLVDQAGRTMAEIVAAIGRVTDVVSEISAASEAQRADVAEVGQSIAQMDQNTQQNAALVDESAAAAESLQRQALQLVQAVAVFKLEASPVKTAPAAPAEVWPSTERRAPDRPANIARLKKLPVLRTPVAPPPKSTGTDDWESF